MRKRIAAAAIAAALVTGACGGARTPPSLPPDDHPTGVEVTPIGIADQARDVAGLVDDRSRRLEEGP